MARPPARYQPERKSGGCGASWNDSVVVRGSLPGTGGFGDRPEFSRTLPVVISHLQSGPGKIGWDGEYESEREVALRRIAEDTMDTIDDLEASGDLPPRKADSCRWLVEGALKQLNGARELRDRWRLRAGGPYGLSYGDSMADFPSAEHWQDCANPGNILTPPGPHYGMSVPGRGRAGNVTCPTLAELQQRPRDRNAIVTLFRDTARWLRCAEWSMWRIVYYRRALEAWLATPEGQSTRVTPEGPRTTPPPQRSPDPPRRTDPDGPVVLQIVWLPELPPDVPDAPEDPPPDPLLPDGSLPPGLGDPSPSPSAKSGGIATGIAVVGVLALGWWAFNKAL